MSDAGGADEGPATGATGLELGAAVRCADGDLGELLDVVVDPRTERVTHLVVAGRSGPATARMVPVALADLSGDDRGTLTLGCTTAAFLDLEEVQMFVFLALGDAPAGGEDWDVGIQAAFGTPSGIDEFGGYAVATTGDVGMTYDRIPKGGRELRRASPVLSADGHRVGHVAGLLVGADGQISHVVLEHGHLWGRRDVTIPIDAVRQVETDAVELSLTRHQVGELPAVRVRRHGRRDRPG